MKMLARLSLFDPENGYFRGCDLRFALYLQGCVLQNGL